MPDEIRSLFWKPIDRHIEEVIKVDQANPEAVEEEISDDGLTDELVRGHARPAPDGFTFAAPSALDTHLAAVQPAVNASCAGLSRASTSCAARKARIARTNPTSTNPG